MKYIAKTPTSFIVTWNLRAQFSPSYLEIYIFIGNNDPGVNEVDIRFFDNECDTLFDTDTSNKLGPSAVCSWTLDLTTPYDITIDLASTSTIDPTGDYVTIRPNSFEFNIIPNDNEIYQNYQDFSLILVLPPDTPLRPILTSVVVPNFIGICDDLILDARSVANIGGRPATYLWEIINSTVINPGLNTTYSGNLVTILSNDILPSTIVIRLTVTTWYNENSIQYFTVTKDSEPQPITQINGPSIFTNENTNKLITLSLNIRFNNCLNTSNTFGYTLEWSATTNVLAPSYDTLDTNKYNNLVGYLNNLNDTNIVIDSEIYMQVGIQYTFNVRIICNSFYNCDITLPHILTFEYSTIKCQILENNQEFLDVPVIFFDDYLFTLDGDTFTFDLDKGTTNNYPHLSYQWDCVNRTNNDDCDNIISDTNASPIVLDILPYINPDSNYQYEFTLTVSDNTNPTRNNCTQTVSIIIKTIATTDNPVDFKYIVASITPIGILNNEMNVNDELRLLGRLSNININDTNTYFKFTWNELTDLLTPQIIEDNKLSVGNSINFVLKSDTLTPGKSYTFELIVEAFDDVSMMNLVGNGTATIAIYVKNGPNIIENSFIIDPTCNQEFSDINNLLETPFDLSVQADGDYPPLTYKFFYDVNEYRFSLHAGLLQSPFINNIYLPPGNIDINVYVRDTQFDIDSYTINCNITLTNKNVCPTSLATLLNEFKTNNEGFTSNDYFRYLFQTSNIILKYLIYTSNTQCPWETNGKNIFDTMYNEFGADPTKLCQSQYTINLGETAILLLKLILSNNEAKSSYLFNTDSENFFRNHLKNIIFSLLDPCEILDGIGNIETLEVRPESIVTKIPKIFYNNQDISPFISKFVFNNIETPKLYRLAKQIIGVVNGYIGAQFDPTNAEAKVLYNMLEKVLYANELARVSLTIPGEQVITDIEFGNIYSTRISDNNADINITGIGISFNELVSRNTFGEIIDDFRSSDIVIVGFNNTNQAVTKKGNKCEKDEYELTGQSLSINLLNDNNVTSLNGNISITFNMDDYPGLDINLFECSWKDINDEWNTAGCQTIKNIEFNTITCNCNHLTTFAMIYDLIDGDCDKKIQERYASSIWRIINIIYGALFTILFLYLVFMLLPFLFIKGLRKKKSLRNRAVKTLLIVMVIVILLVFICIQSLFLDEWYQYHARILEFLLLLPLYFWFLLFSFIFNMYYNVAMSIVSRSAEKISRLNIVLVIVNIILIIVFIASYILRLIFLSNELFREFLTKFAEILWTSIISICSVVFTIYGFKMSQVLVASAKHTSSQSFGKRDRMIARKLIFICVNISFFFILNTAIYVFFIIVQERSDVMFYIFRIAELSAHLLCLCVVIFMYHRSIRIMKDKEGFLSGTSIRNLFRSKTDKSKLTDGSRTSTNKINYSQKQSNILPKPRLNMVPSKTVSDTNLKLPPGAGTVDMRALSALKRTSNTVTDIVTEMSDFRRLKSDDSFNIKTSDDDVTNKNTKSNRKRKRTHERNVTDFNPNNEPAKMAPNILFDNKSKSNLLLNVHQHSNLNVVAKQGSNDELDSPQPYDDSYDPNYNYDENYNNDQNYDANYDNNYDDGNYDPNYDENYDAGYI